MAFSSASLAAAVQAAVGGGTFITSSLLATTDFSDEIKDEFAAFNVAEKISCAIMVAEFKLKAGKFEQEDDGSNQMRSEMAEMFAGFSYGYGSFDESFTEVFDPVKGGADPAAAVKLCFPNGVDADVKKHVKDNGTTPASILPYIGNHLAVVCKMGEGTGHWSAKFTKLFNSRLGELTIMGKKERELTFTLMQRNYQNTPKPGEGGDDYILGEMVVFKEVLGAVDNVLAQQVSRVAGIGNTPHELIYSTMNTTPDFPWKATLEGDSMTSKKLNEEFAALRVWKDKFDADPWIVFKGGAGPGTSLQTLVYLCRKIQELCLHNETWKKYKGGKGGEHTEQIDKWVEQYQERQTEDTVDLPAAPPKEEVLVLDGIKYTAPTI